MSQVPRTTKKKKKLEILMIYEAIQNVLDVLTHIQS